MPNKTEKKHGKGRKDKYYYLAKAQGYRSRAAFKLLEVDKAFGEFLSEARIVVDLCAAPGGWCQVARSRMPMSSMILGIDLDPIQPIKGVTTMVDDITTEHCRKAIANYTKGYKVDAVLCDGAPNAGVSQHWDAHVQNSLALSAMSLAADVLLKDGTFVTKLFRSKDHTSLVFVGEQLFDRVTLFKPKSSRAVSSEIFMVCQGYKAPTSIDKRMFDVNEVFADVQGPTPMPNLFRMPKSKPRHRTGYADDAGSLLYTTKPVAMLIDSDNPQKILSETNTFTWTDVESKVYGSHPDTTDEIRKCLEDIRVLSKRDLKDLLKWRKKMRVFAGMEDDGPGRKDDDTTTTTTTTAPLDLDALAEADDDTLAAEMKRFKERLRAIEKRKKRKERARQAKYRQHLSLSLPMGDALIAPNELLFEAQAIPSADILQALTSDKAALDSIEMYDDDVYIDPEEAKRSAPPPARELTAEEAQAEMEYLLEQDYLAIKNKHAQDGGRITVGKKLKRVRRLGVSTELYMDIKAKEMGLDKEAAAIAKLKPNVDNDIFADELRVPDDSSDDDDDDDSSDDDAGSSGSASSDTKFFEALKAKRAAAAAAEGKRRNPLLLQASDFGLDDDDTAASASGAGALVLSADIFQGLEVEDDAVEAVNAIRGVKKGKDSGPGGSRKRGREDEDPNADARDLAAAAAAGNSDGDEDESDDESSSEGELTDSSSDPIDSDDELVDFDVAPQDPMSFSDSDDKAEYLAMAKTMALRRDREALIDKSYNRRAFNETNLPVWYEDYLAENNQPSLPITKEMVDELKAIHKAVNARPIKKVAEAKARKKMRTVRKLEKMKKQVAAVANDSDLTERARAQEIEKLYRRGNAAVQRPKRRLIIGKRTETRQSGRKVKSLTRAHRMVDRRLKADTRNRVSKKLRSKRARFKRR